MSKHSSRILSIAAFFVAVAMSASLAYSAGKIVIVTMTDKPPKYVPETLTIPVGTTVEWKNTGQTLHDVTTDSSSAVNEKDAKIPPGAETFDSGFMPPGGTFQYTFKVPGEYTYFCTPHEKDGMIGHIVVTK
ncbi:MAG: plastocyanin/azurin family copper-binding protein [Candidatus Binataceae bacterium]|jgi:plastocyanin